MSTLDDLAWWQALFAVLATLGLSPAPWILGLALGRIQFTGPTQRMHEARVEDLKAQHLAAIAELARHHGDLVELKDEAYAALRESRDGYKEATAIERGRADKVTTQLGELGELAKIAVHTLSALDEAAKDPTP